ncbi:hypothetical protein MLD38_014131 [Melastoma candidum]|uniref:Uncharacterized protein n=1 Tax=Melastoma candidum TaxID=119954 RepID=A0ACB9RBF0_9MYRT|nr:hypothetical protein MLD38_014131 [Melastoma candidum]
MVRTPQGGSSEVLSKGAWTASEDKLLVDYVRINGEGRWSRLSRETGLKRCGKSCRLRWMNYLRPDIKRGNISADEEELIIRLHKLLGNRWSLIAGRLPGRTDNEIKNYWNTNIAKKKPELLLPRRVSLGTIQQNSDPNPRGNDENKEPQLEQTDNDGTMTFRQMDNVITIQDPEGLPTHESHIMQGMLLSDSDYLTDGSLSLMSSPEGKNPNDFLIDFTVEDICKILDADFTSLGDVNMSNEDPSNIDCFVNECKPASPAAEDMVTGEFPKADDVAGFPLLESFFGPDDEDGKGVEVRVGDADVQPQDII